MSALCRVGSQCQESVEEPGVFSSPAIGANGTVYFGTEANDDTLYAVSNNTLIWSYQTGGAIYSSPAILKDGTVIFAAGDGNVYALFGSTPLATNCWPMFMNNSAHTSLQSPPSAETEGCGAPFLYDGTNDGMGDFTFNIVGSNSTVWNVYWSSNLSNWTQIGTNLTLPTNIDDFNGNTNFTDTSVTNVPYRFYELSNSGGCASRIIGFVNLDIEPGTNLIADQLCQVDDNVLSSFFPVPMNTVNDVFGPYWSPDQQGTEVMLWNGQSFDVLEFISYIENPYWYDLNSFNYVAGDSTVLPGMSLLISNANNAFTNTFTGMVREQQVIQVQPGTNFLSSTFPVSGAITNITGYIPQAGDIIQLWNTTSNIYQSFTNTGGGWSPASPRNVGVGEGFVLITTNAYIWTNTWPH